MSLSVDTLFGDVESHSTDQSLLHRLNERDLSHSAIVLDGAFSSSRDDMFSQSLPELNITANRLFGPHPKTATYVCIWEIHLGSVKASLSAYEARIVSAASNSFAIDFSDPLNAPAKEFVISADPDGNVPSFVLGMSIEQHDSHVPQGYIRLSIHHLASFRGGYRAGAA